MLSLKEQIEKFQKEINEFNVATAADIENYRIRFLGAKGIVKQLLAEIKNVAPELKKDAGQ